MKANMGKKQSYKNIAMNVFAFVVQFFISFISLRSLLVRLEHRPMDL